MPKSKDLSKMSVEQLEEYNNILDEEYLEIRAEKQRVHDQIDALNAEEEAARILETVSDAQKAALRQQIESEGIKSAEHVNEV